MTSDLDRELRKIAERQHGLLTRHQLSQLGASSDAVAHRCDTGVLERLSRRVLRLAGSVPSDEQRLLAAVLDAGAGAVLTGPTAAACWGIPGFRLDVTEVLRPRSARGRTGGLGRVRTTRVLPAHHVLCWRGIPITSPARTVFELAGTHHPLRVERALDHAWGRRLLTGAAMHRVADDLRRHGRAGSALVGRLLRERPVDHRAAESALERRFEQLARDVGVTTLDRQVDVGGEAWLGRSDFRDREVRLVVFVDGELWHAGATDRERDDQQVEALRAAGVEVERFGEFDVWYRPTEVQRRLLAARHRARPRRRPAA